MRIIQSLCGGWRFSKTGPDRDLTPVTLPHTWNAEDGAHGKNDYFRGACTYTRTLPALDFHEDERVLLIFYVVNQTAGFTADQIRIIQVD